MPDGNLDFYSKSFNCSNSNLVTLSDIPATINGIFRCYGNLLSNLVNGPIKVTSDYDCRKNRLTSLDGIASFIGGHLYCDMNNDLIDVSAAFDSAIRHSLSISYNKNLAVLPLLKFNINVIHNLKSVNYSVSFNKIINNHKNNSSKENIIKCQYELMENGFENNARWKP